MQKYECEKFYIVSETYVLYELDVDTCQLGYITVDVVDIF